MRFKDETHVLRIVNKIVSAVGRRVDESQPMIDARLADGSRINVAVRPIAVDGPLVSIRKFAEKAFELDGLVSVGTMTQRMSELLAGAVRARLTILVSGGTGSGKTTLLNALSTHISHRERLITIEDAAELRLQQPHVGRLETRPPNIEGKGEIRQRELVKNALRMRPDRIVVGECRGAETLDMLQAMNTGHDGSLTTLHANSPRDALNRLETLVLMAGMELPSAAIRDQIVGAIDLIVQTSRMPDGSRKITYISEIVGERGADMDVRDIFVFKQSGFTPDGKVKGLMTATGEVPQFVKSLQERNIPVNEEWFRPQRSLEAPAAGLLASEAS